MCCPLFPTHIQSGPAHLSSYDGRLERRHLKTGVNNPTLLIRFLSEAGVPFLACTRGRGCVHLRENRYKMPSLVLTSSENVNTMEDVDEGLNNTLEIKVSTNLSLIRVFITSKVDQRVQFAS